MKSSPLKSFEHSVARRLRAELRGEGMANYFLRRYSEAVDACDRALARNPGLNTQMLSHPMLAATYAEMGRQQARRTQIEGARPEWFGAIPPMHIIRLH
jgi:hypothetical protein